MTPFLADVTAVAAKDLRIHWRSGTALTASLGFAAIALVIINFARDATALSGALMAPSALWVTLAFASTTALHRSFAVEAENAAGDLLRLSPIAPEAVFFGKWLANLALVWSIAAIALPLTAIFFNVSFGRALPGVSAAVLLAMPGFVAVGTILGALTVRTRFAALLLPLLLLPFLLPPLVGGVQVTARLLAGRPLSEVVGWLRLLAVYDIVFIAVSALLFPAVVDE